ncbi:RNA polymerase sigma-70 factor [Pedobacter deserti]|uniref:RNA polymerase sigma-70 factor n=1 Tax=Pedobacter deserti TaxID=2817382 RepID=UPI00210CBE89|nr:RNA polymerase sigma-70 factor [Pedobacter sp. SYSU D00382]
MKINNRKIMPVEQALLSPKLLLEVVYEIYYDRLLYFAWTMIHDKEVAKDLVQEAFVSYWEHREIVTVDAVKVRNFLYVAVRNGCLKYIRHNKVVDRYLAVQDPEPMVEGVALEQMIKAEVIGQIYAAIATLPQAMQQISRMAYLKGMKNHEIADELGISINTVKTQKQRAVQLLRVKLKPESFLVLLSFYMAHKC